MLETVPKPRVVLPGPMAPPPLPSLVGIEVVLIDWPWLHRDRQGCDPKRGGFRYPPLPTEAALDIPLLEHCAPQCAIVMWVTQPMEAQGEHCKLAGYLGFTLVTKLFTWVKVNPKVDISAPILCHQGKGGGLRSGQGYYTNNGTECCYVGWRLAKGRRFPRLHRDVKELVFCRVTEHSAKPNDIVRPRIERLWGERVRFEMFARDRAPGWYAWGLEVDRRL